MFILLKELSLTDKNIKDRTINIDQISDIQSISNTSCTITMFNGTSFIVEGSISEITKNINGVTKNTLNVNNKKQILKD